MEGWVKIWRQFEKWEWYGNSRMVHLLLHCVLSANHEPARWQGINIERGQFVSSAAKICSALGFTPKELRTCLARLVKAGELAIKTTNQYSLYTVVRYEEFQEDERETANKTANEGQAGGNQRATNNNENNENNEKKEDNARANFSNLFEEFFSSAPKQQNKSEASVLFEGITEISKEELVEKMKLYAASIKKGEEQFANNPAVWLKKRRWLDVTTPAQPKPQTPEERAYAIFKAKIYKLAAFEAASYSSSDVREFASMVKKYPEFVEKARVDYAGKKTKSNIDWLDYCLQAIAKL